MNKPGPLDNIYVYSRGIMNKHWDDKFVMDRDIWLFQKLSKSTGAGKYLEPVNGTVVAFHNVELPRQAPWNYSHSSYTISLMKHVMDNKECIALNALPTKVRQYLGTIIDLYTVLPIV
jgi:hypothetical protein